MSTANPEANAAAAVRIANLSFSYGSTLALDDITLSFPAGRVSALTGPNGSGKSTLMAIIAGLAKQHTGTLTLAHPGSIAFVPQIAARPEQLPLSVGEAVSMGTWSLKRLIGSGGKARRDLVDSSLELFGILPLKHKQFSELSGGQRQRVLLAQAVAQQAKLLILDEPTTGLDPESTATIDSVIRELSRQGTTVLQATHDLDSALKADYAVVLKAGKTVAAGNPAEVLSAENIADFFGLGH